MNDRLFPFITGALLCHLFLWAVADFTMEDSRLSNNSELISCFNSITSPAEADYDDKTTFMYA